MKPIIKKFSEENMTKNLYAEVVERKGIGHPDSMCDGFAEACSRALSKRYIEEYGTIAHHNIDKALLLCARFDGKYEFGSKAKLEKPIKYIQAGRVTKVGGFKDLLKDTITDYCNENFRFLDPSDEKQFKILLEVDEGSAELQKNADKFEVPHAGDTSFGCGFAPRTPTEELAYQTERYINSKLFKERFPAAGEDVKAMCSRDGEIYSLTAAIAMVASKISSKEEYLDIKESIKKNIDKNAEKVLDKFNIDFVLNSTVNNADNPEKGIFYLTLTGLCCEKADEGQIGRGNRMSGLITPMRPMSLEAPAGKNPKNHTGKIYNAAACLLSEEIADKFREAEEVQVIMQSNIGDLLTEPNFLNIKISGRQIGKSIKKEIENYCLERLTDEFFNEVTQKIIDGKIGMF